MNPIETVAVVFLANFVLVQPWIAFAGPDGPRRFSVLDDDGAREALDRAVRWDHLTPRQRTAIDVVAGLVGVTALVAGLVAGAAWLAAVAVCLVTVAVAVLVRRRGRSTVLESARVRGTEPSPRTRSATRLRRQRGLAVVLVACLLGAPVAYRSDGVAVISGAFASGVLVVLGTLALIGLIAVSERSFGDEEPG